jgi:Secretion system C-terminal sorting domain
MRLIICFCIVFGLSGVRTYAQNLVSVGGGIPTTYGIYNGTITWNNEIYAADNAQIYKWNGTSWLSLGIVVDQAILCMTVYNNELYVGGWFENFNGLPVNRIVKYDGASWTGLGSGILVANNVVGGVEKMIVYNGELIAIGGFVQAGNVNANQIARWNGIAWDSLGSGITGLSSIPSMCVYNNELCVFSQITNAGGVPVNNAAKWNGNTWSGIGSGLFGFWPVSSTVYNNELYVGLSLGPANSNSIIVKWNGVLWTAVEQNISSVSNNIVFDLTEHKGCLYATGLIDTINGVPVNNVARFDGFNWSSVGNGVSHYGVFFTTLSNELYLTGDFSYSGSSLVNNVVRFDASPVCFTSTEQITTVSGESIQIYPNPATSTISVNAVLTNYSNSSYVIYDVCGKIVSSGMTINSRIEIDSLQEGFYLLKIDCNGGAKMTGFVKQ